MATGIGTAIKNLKAAVPRRPVYSDSDVNAAMAAIDCVVGGVYPHKADRTPQDMLSRQ